METAILMEIENLRRASLAALRGKYREVFEDTTVQDRTDLSRGLLKTRAFGGFRRAIWGKVSGFN